MKSNEPAYVENQYRTSQALRQRISLHELYSTQPQPFADWIFKQYALRPGMRVLEVGCGTGDAWRGRAEHIPADVHITLTDVSQAMVEEARATLGQDERFSFENADVQTLRFADAAFDVVIANMMLYHVPDLARAVDEIGRVLKPDGVLYAATMGEGGIHGYLMETLPEIGASVDLSAWPFTLQNGAASLLRVFPEVTVRRREDGLRITRIEDWLDYVASLSFFRDRPFPREQAMRCYQAKMHDGVLWVPKEYGLFIARKASRA